MSEVDPSLPIACPAPHRPSTYHVLIAVVDTGILLGITMQACRSLLLASRGSVALRSCAQVREKGGIHEPDSRSLFRFLYRALHLTKPFDSCGVGPASVRFLLLFLV